jgi:hypothetical protein
VGEDDSRVLRRIFEPVREEVTGSHECSDEPLGSGATEGVMKEEVTGDWTEILNDELHNLYFYKMLG